MEIKKTKTGLPLLDNEQIQKVLNNSLKIKKGVALLGETGSGKTTAFKNWIDSLKQNSEIAHSDIPVYVTASDLVKGYETVGEKYFTQKIDPKFNDIAYCFDKDHKRAIYIDDLGAERDLKYGQGNILQEILKRLLDFGVVVYFSTNFNLDLLKEKYSEAILSRIKGSCGIVVSDNPDYRQLQQEDIITELLNEV